MDREKIQEYDLRKLREAMRLVGEVYEYYYRAPGYRQAEARLETIYDKLESLLKLQENK